MERNIMSEWIWIDPAWDLGAIDPHGIAVFRPVVGGYGQEMLVGSEIPKGVDATMRAFAPIIRNSSNFWPMVGVGVLAICAVGAIYWLATRPPNPPVTITIIKRKEK
jgi:hypothetical protein